MKKFQKSLFLFTRDLRINDNTGLIQACKNSENVLPCFIFNPKISWLKNSRFRTQFLIESLLDLEEQFKKRDAKLDISSGNFNKVISKVIDEQKIDAVFSNLDYTPYAMKKTLHLKDISNKKNVNLNLFHDFLLHEIDTIKTDKGNPYVIYSQFFKKAKNYPIIKSQKNNFKNFEYRHTKNNVNLKDIIKKFSINEKDELRIPGGRTEGLKILRKIKNFREHQENRDFPSLDATTHLSAHNKFGTISIREVYQEIKKTNGKSHTLIGELYWREFFTNIMYHFPYSFNKAFRKKYEKIPWSKNVKVFEKWKSGKTGFPIVDAGMIELNNTGYMHNRVRMIVASFLTKDLHINWKWGERYFAEKLIDYDPSVNVGNWQWSASTGCDAQPWFRIFNPWLQQEKYDKDCLYIKKWIPELEEFSPKEIHKWHSIKKESKYPKPIVTHSEEVFHTKEMFQKISN